MVEITQERYEELLRKENILEALEAWGVDNWDGYSYALSEMED